MAITDLKGTTWNVPSGWTATAGYGRFDVGVIVNGNDYSSRSDGEFDIGYDFDFPSGYGVFESPNAITFGDYAFDAYYGSQTFTVEFVEGSDLTNTSLISWLEANGELQTPETPTEYIEVTYADKAFKLSAGQKITFKGGKVMQSDIVAKVVEAETEDDLAGTWVFDDEPDIFTSQTYNISFTSNNQTYSKLSCTYGGEVYFLNYDEMLAYFNQPSYEASGWEDEAYKTINITSKLSEATNGAELLAWLKANATKQGVEEVTLGDITITVNSFSALTFTLRTSEATVETKTASSGTVTFSNITSDMYIKISGAINQFNLTNAVNCTGSTGNRLIIEIGTNASITVANFD